MTEEQVLFIADAREIVDRLYRDLEELRGARSEGRRRRELAAQVFRRVHTLKGSGASLDLRSVSAVAHEFEGVLDGARLGRVELTDAVLDTFDDALDEIARALRAAPAEDAGPEITAITRRLGALAAQSKNQGAIASSLRSALPEDIARSLSEYDLQHAREAIREGAKLFIVSAGFALDNFDQAFRELSKLLGQSGEIIATVPGEASTPEEITFRLLYAAELLPAETLRVASSLGRIEHCEIKVELPAGGSEPTPGSPPASGRQSIASAEPPVRVELKQVEELISTASELFRQTSTALLTVAGPARADAAEAAIRNLRARFAEFEERLIKLRLVPVREVFERAAARAGRVAARQLGKEVEFVIVGGDVGIEKSLAELIADPLSHLVRNAITHGIEDPATRQANGKSATGRITLTASNHSGRIHITVMDDGRGIDVDSVAGAAAAHGIASERLSVDQCLRLIFRPGFSTSPELSEMSGRGIGLDVVDRAMDLAGGEAKVATQAGAGTTFAMIIPAALSLVRCLIVRCADRIYAIDAACVTELDQGDSSLASSMSETDLEQLPFHRLSSLLEQDHEDLSGSSTVILWRAPAYSPHRRNGREAYRIAFDAIVGRQETLVRSLGRYSARWAGVCGAAELFDGNVALMLDLEELIKNANEKNG